MIVFARAEARDPYPGRAKSRRCTPTIPTKRRFSTTSIAVPFNDGRGGTPEPIAGASKNGMSNNFPKVSPDGKWIVFVQCRNGQLMRPDSQLVHRSACRRRGAAAARKHVADEFLAQLFAQWTMAGVFVEGPVALHADVSHPHRRRGQLQPRDSDRQRHRGQSRSEHSRVRECSRRRNRGDSSSRRRIYKLIDQAMRLEEKGKNDEALIVWKKAAAIEPENARVQNGLGISLYIEGNTAQAFEHLRHSIRLNPRLLENHLVLGKFLLEQGRAQEAVQELQTAIAIRPRSAPAEEALASALEAMGNWSGALEHWQKALEIEPGRTSAMLGAAWLLATTPDAGMRNGAEAGQLAEEANAQGPADDPNSLDVLSAAYAEQGDFTRASELASNALDLASQRNEEALASVIRSRLKLYAEKKPYRESQEGAAFQARRSVQASPVAR